MPQKGRFVEDVQTQNSSFTSASRGQISDKSLGTLFEGAGKVVGDAIKVADNQFQESIQNKVDAFYSKEQEDLDPAIAELSSEGVPSEITNGTENIIKMSKALGNGLISDSQFFMRASALSKRLKNQYPGHKEYVDRAIQQARGTSANMVRRQLLSELDKLSSASQKNAQYTQKELNKLIGSGHLNQSEIDSAGPEKALSLGLHRAGQDEQFLRNAQRIKVGQETKEINNTQATDEFISKSARGHVTNKLSQIFRKSFPNSGSDLYSMGRYIASQAGQTLSGEQSAQLVASFKEISTTIRGDVIRNAREAGLDDKGLKRVNEYLDENLEAINQGLFDKDYGLVGSLISNLGIQEAAEVNRYIQTNDLKNVQVVNNATKELFGANSPTATLLLDEYNNKYSKPINAAAANWAVNGLIHGNSSLSEQMTAVSKSTTMTPQDKAFAHKHMFDTANSALKELSPNHPMFVKTATALFKDNPQEILKHWDTQDKRLQVFNALIDPAVQSKLLASEVGADYGLWVRSAWTSIAAQEVGDLNKAINAQRAGIFKGSAKVNNISFDPSTMRFQSEIDARADQPQVGPGGRATIAQQQVHAEAQRAVAKMNSMMERLEPVFKSQGNPVVAMGQLLRESGVEMNPVTGQMKYEGGSPWIQSAADSVFEWVMQQVAKERQKLVPVVEGKKEAISDFLQQQSDAMQERIKEQPSGKPAAGPDSRSR